MNETAPQTITVRTGQMIFAISSDEEGVNAVVSVTDDSDTDATEPINLGGAWAGLVDADAMLDALERMGHEAPSSPPIVHRLTTMRTCLKFSYKQLVICDAREDSWSNETERVRVGGWEGELK